MICSIGLDISLTSCEISLSVDKVSFEAFITTSTSLLLSSVAKTDVLAEFWILVSMLAILFVASFDSSDSFLISLATIAKPLPCSPALAASTDAFNASILVCSVISSTTAKLFFTCCNVFVKSRIISATICIFCFKLNILSDVVVRASFSLSEYISVDCALSVKVFKISLVC